MMLALEAAKTGHKVFATIHANSATETVTRAIDLLPDRKRDGITLASALKFVIAQRRIETYVGELKERRKTTHNEREWLQRNGLKSSDTTTDILDGVISGKTSVHEAIVIDYEISRLILNDYVDPNEIYKLARNQPQYETLAMAGFRLAETHGVRLHDCTTQLESTPACAEFPAKRIQLANEYKLSLAKVAEGMDGYAQLLANPAIDPSTVSIHDVFNQIRFAEAH
jgi:type II secretory ATPase GspE/PulE/Tfp pilus assembly ATPase PilB-like protein